MKRRTLAAVREEPARARRAADVDWLVYALVAGVGALCYANSLDGDFVHDDIPAVVANKDVTGESPLYQVFLNDFWGTPMADPASHKSYRPLTTLSFRFTHKKPDLHVSKQIYILSPAPYAYLQHGVPCLIRYSVIINGDTKKFHHSVLTKPETTSRGVTPAPKRPTAGKLYTASALTVCTQNYTTKISRTELKGFLFRVTYDRASRHVNRRSMRKSREGNNENLSFNRDKISTYPCPSAFSSILDQQFSLILFPKSSHRCVVGLLDRNRMSDGVEEVGHGEVSGPPELSLNDRKSAAITRLEHTKLEFITASATTAVIGPAPHGRGVKNSRSRSDI
ncbi:Transmembrane and TPR repeat-containing protein 3 [Eumeta japonica]|uniref:Transmembrane and TPR repeat-containing protein 3 n=1 Tax=Eumeta variegata TaxID=151549 RepID=A0A4C1Y4C9_EUMVA|nr:Transmembrane and TPR repeat-containing protein 3 [Eumeta japonica]